MLPHVVRPFAGAATEIFLAGLGPGGRHIPPVELASQAQEWVALIRGPTSVVTLMGHHDFIVEGLEANGIAEAITAEWASV
jgi:hypothetical protein